MKRQLCAFNAVGLIVTAVVVFFGDLSHPPSDERAVTAIILSGIALALGFVWALTEPPPRRQARPTYDRLRAVYRRASTSARQ